MKRNSIFNKIPLWKPKMSSFNLSFENKLSTDLFRLTPVMCKEVLPDDRIKLRPECFTRMSPAISPFFHRLDIRFYHFFVPTRIIWEDFEKWINPKTGTSDLVHPRLNVNIGANVNNEDGSVGGVSAAYAAFGPKSLGDYLGVNFGLNAADQSSYQAFVNGLNTIFPDNGDYQFSLSSLPFRAYQQIYNDWFIDLNNAEPAEFSKGSGVESLVPGISDEAVSANSALYKALLKLRYRAWEHDYFTSALPEPQRGPDVNAFDGGDVQFDNLEIVGDGTPVMGGLYSLTSRSVQAYSDQSQLLRDYFSSHYQYFGYASPEAALDDWAAGNVTLQFNTATIGSDNYEQSSGFPVGFVITSETTNISLDDTAFLKTPSLRSGEAEGSIGLGKVYTLVNNIAQHLSVRGGSSSGSIPAVTVEELRVRMQMQSFLERNEIGGSRYTEMLYAHWGVKDPDGRLQRSEFLGGHKQPLVVSDLQSTVDDLENNKPLGTFAGNGVSSSGGRVIKYRVPEHGFIISLMCVVPRSSYSQGLEKMWTRFDRLDYYWPSFSHLGEQEVKNQEIMFTGFDPEGTFGYQSRYAEYKTSLDQVHGDLKGSLSHWHMGRIFNTPTSAEELPKLSQHFTTPTDSDSDALSRVWPVFSGNVPGGFEADNADHFVFDVYMHCIAGRRMPFFVTPRNGM